MKKNILIATNATDIHATAVSMALKSRGHNIVRWVASGYPNAQDMTFSVSSNGLSPEWLLAENSIPIAADNFDAIWLRRPQQAVLSNKVHKDDFSVAARQANFLLKDIWSLIGKTSFWVNPYPSAYLAEYKPLQLKIAAEVGFSIPSTIFSNNPEHIKSFVREHNGHVVVKGLTVHEWDLDNSGCAVLYTNKISESDLTSDHELQITPCIYQALVIKACDLRVTYFGTKYFAVSIRSEQDDVNAIDWRSSNLDKLTLEPSKLPENIDFLCQKLLERMNLVFGCFDLIITPTGEYIFLEVNQAGQFLWIERILPDLHLLDAFCDFITGERRTEKSTNDHPRVHYREILESGEFKKMQHGLEAGL